MHAVRRAPVAFGGRPEAVCSGGASYRGEKGCASPNFSRVHARCTRRETRVRQFHVADNTEEEAETSQARTFENWRYPKCGEDAFQK